MTKRFQKFLAISLAATMAISSTVFAAPVTDPTGTSNVTGVGTTEYVDTNVYSVTLPTAAALSFNLDPQGLLSLEDGKSATIESLSGNAGKVVGSTSACVINDSAKAIKVSVSMAATVKTAGDVTLKKNAEGISDNATTNNILLCAIPAVSSISTANAYQTASQGYILEQTPAVETGLTLTSANTDQLTFVLDAATYEVSKNGSTYTYNKAGSGNGTGIQIGGLVNSKDDWKDFTGTPTKTVGLTAIFAFSPADGTEVVNNDNAYGFVSAKNSAGTALGTIAAANKTGPISVHIAKGSTGNTAVTLGGTFKSLKLVSLGGVAKGTALVSGTHFTATANKLTILGSWSSKMTATAVTEATITVDGQDTTQTITLYFD